MLTGILLTLAAAACFECSYVLQALELRAVPAMGRASVGALRGLAARPLWLVSIALGLAGFGLQVLALRHVPLSLVQPLLAIGLLGLLAFAASVLGEPVGRREGAAVLAIVGGVTIVALADPQRGEDATVSLGFVLAATALGLVALSAFAARRESGGAARGEAGGGARRETGAAARRDAGAGRLLAAAIAADALASLAAAQAARALPGVLALAGWCALAGVAGIAAIAAESAVLQRRGAARVAPVVLAGQVAIPVALAPLVIGESWGSPALFVCGLALVIAGGGLLAASAGVGRLALGQPEHEVGGGGQVRDLGT
jgi:drug/metabolite transporter (DMT)-like permease